MKKVKVLCVLPSLRICNGVASYAMNYYRNISNIDIDFVVANLDTKSDYFDEIKANGNKIYNLSKNASKNFFDYIYKIKNFFKENANKYDIIHCHVANAGAIFLYYAKKYGIKVRIIHSHATETSDNKIKQIRNNLILPLTIHNATNYFACSDKAGKAMFKNKKFCVVNNAINCEKYKFNEAYREEIRKEFNIENDEYLIGNIGRFVHQKNQEYLLNIANSTFENWRKANPDKSIDEFDFQLNKMSVSGALFDMIKLLDIGKTVISKMTAEEVYNYSLIWAKEYDEELAKMLEDKEYALKVFGIERGNKKPRKDISKWSDVMYNIGYMYDDEFYGKVNEYPYQVISDKEDIAKILDLYISKYYNESDDKQTWFDKIKELAVEMGYAGEVKEFKANPGMYKAHVGDVSTVLRVALTARTNTPDMYEIMQVLGKNRIAKRLEVAKENLK